ncbi:hypothetical protein LWI29_023145 [Acer saccharum]|uniref:CASP-like protein n=1 Tax=Acer saccharum TaxID=4024 RepID=A0AA39RSK3_ACESA|nr:hypothetical protein LWI29_023145 [Acer saccharum]KAK1557375.1 hypothetical protein Q3G72_023505 [Acer saccharum]KAK1584340.1 hypothetical protein Q3G72_032124 [Acer saccharum]
MALQIEEKPTGSMAVVERKKDWVVLVLRVVAFLATAAATLVMALNKQTITLVVATIGNTPIKASLTAKFQHTPAFVFFVVANSMVSFHNLLMIAVNIFAHKFDYKGLGLVTVAILDMANVGLVSGGVNAAVFMAELGKNGNDHARWNKICDKFESFCNQGAGALIASFIGLALMLIISSISITKLVKLKSTHLQLAQP